MISRTRSRIATSNPSRREPSWPTSLTMLAFAMAYSSCALNLQSRDSGLSPLLTSQENTPSLFLQESGRSRQPAASRPYGKNWHCSLKGSQKTEGCSSAAMLAPGQPPDVPGHPSACVSISLVRKTPAEIARLAACPDPKINGCTDKVLR